MAAPGYFPPALRAFAARNKIAGLRHPPLALRPCAALRVLARSARRLVIATKAAMGAVNPTKENPMTIDRDEQTYDPALASKAQAGRIHQLSSPQTQLFRLRDDSATPAYLEPVAAS